MDKRVCSNCGSRPATFDDDVCPQCAWALYADEDEPDQYREGDGDEAEDHRLDDPRHGQAEELNKER